VSNITDATPNFKDFRKDWAAHRKDFTRAGRPFLWKGDKGKGILGMLDYLATSGVNSVSMLLWNTGGDDRNVFPHLLAVDEQTYVGAELEYRRGKRSAPRRYPPHDKLYRVT